MKKVFVVGHAKSGTTLVASQLSKYFTTSSLGKEPVFFDYRNGINDLSEFKKEDLIDYENSFNGASKTLDANPWNVGENSAKLIYQYFPDSYIIICQRDPLKRILSHYEHYLRNQVYDGKTAYSLSELLSDEMLKNIKNLDKEIYDEKKGTDGKYPILPLDMLAMSDTSKTFYHYCKYFSRDKIYVFDLDKQKNDNDISEQLSVFLDESILFKLKLTNSASSSPSVFIRKLYRKFDFFGMEKRVPLWLRERLKKLAASVFPQERFTPSETDIELIKHRIHQYGIKTIQQRTND